MEQRLIPSALARLLRRLPPWAAPIAVVVGVVVGRRFRSWVLAEGVWSLAMFDRPHRALASKLWHEAEPPPLPGDPFAASVRDRGSFTQLRSGDCILGRRRAPLAGGGLLPRHLWIPRDAAHHKRVRRTRRPEQVGAARVRDAGDQPVKA